MSTPLIIGFGALGAIIIGMIIFQLVSKSGSKKADAMREYAEALNYLIAGNHKQALEKLRQSVLKDTENVDAYIKIGDLFREMGQVDRAIKVHLDLTVREGLNASQQIQIYRGLVLDYHAAGQQEQSWKFVEKILSYAKDDQWALEWKLRLCEEKQDWDEAFNVRKRIQKRTGIRDMSILALYRVEQGKQLVRSGEGREGRIRFREAIKIDPECMPAYLELCDSYIRESRSTDALHELRRLISAVPKHAHLAFDRIKEILFDVGSFGDIQNIYESIIQRNPDLVEAHLGLATLYEKKGDIYKAIESCRQALSRDSSSVKARVELARLYQAVNKHEEAIRYALEALDRISDIRPKFRCKECGYESDVPFWLCLQCGAWNSALE